MGKLIGQTAPESNPKATTGRGAQGPPHAYQALSSPRSPAQGLLRNLNFRHRTVVRKTNRGQETGKRTPEPQSGSITDWLRETYPDLDGE